LPELYLWSRKFPKILRILPYLDPNLVIFWRTLHVERQNIFPQFGLGVGGGLYFS